MVKRLIVTGPRRVVFEDVAAPRCPDNGLLVRARLTAVSPGTELRVYRAIPVDEEGKFLHEQIPFALPTENGYSMVGDVVEVGPRVDGFSVGDRVFVPEPHKQVAAVAANLASKLPDTVSDEHGVFLNILGVGDLALRRGDPAPGANIAIVGQGVIGLSALAYCRAFGFRTAVVDMDQSRLQVSMKMGADLAVSPDLAGFAESIREHFDGEGADVAIEAASNWEAVRTAMQLARIGGKVVIASRHTSKPHFNPVGHPFLGKQLELLTTYGYPPDGHRWDRRRSFAFTIDLLANGKLDIAPLVTHHFAWQELPNVYDRLDRGETEIVGAVIDWR